MARQLTSSSTTILSALLTYRRSASSALYMHEYTPVAPIRHRREKKKKEDSRS